MNTIVLDNFTLKNRMEEIEWLINYKKEYACEYWLETAIINNFLMNIGVKEKENYNIFKAVYLYYSVEISVTFKISNVAETEDELFNSSFVMEEGSNTFYHISEYIDKNSESYDSEIEGIYNYICRNYYNSNFYIGKL